VLSPSQMPTGTTHTTTVALLMMAFLFIPALVFVSRPIAYESLWFAIAASLLCAILAGLNWARLSNLTIPTIAGRRNRAG